MPLRPRQKKLILVLCFLPALIIYMGVALAVADFLPGNWFIQLVYFVFVGSVWAFPLKPVFGWANYDPDPQQADH